MVMHQMPIFSSRMACLPSMWPFRSWDENSTKIFKKSSFYSQSILIIIHKSTVVESHPTTGENRKLLRPRSTPAGITVYFYMSSSLIYILEIHRRKFQTLRLMKTLWKIITCFLCYGI